MRQSDTKRMTLDLTPAQNVLLNQLTQQLDTTSRAATLRIAIKVLEMIVGHVSQGSTLIIRDKTGQEVQVIHVSLLPCLPPKEK